MKWSNIIAQGFSPGRWQPRNRPVGATDECDVNRQKATLRQMTTLFPLARCSILPPLQGGPVCGRLPGLKPRGLIYNRFAVNAPGPKASALEIDIIKTLNSER
jgi:hypothetical protein